MREVNIILKEEIIEEIYKKRKEIDELQKLISPMIKETKEIFYDTNSFYAATQNYNVTLRQMYKCNENFIKLLERKGMDDLITKQCVSSDFQKASEILNIKPDDKDYRDLYQVQLMIKKKHM